MHLNNRARDLLDKYSAGKPGQSDASLLSGAAAGANGRE